MSSAMVILIVLFVCQCALAAPVMVKTPSLGRFLIAATTAFMGVTLPLLGFLLSSLLPLDSKQACRNGWTDCFIEAKIVLAPLAIWATVALYALDVLRVKNRTRPWIVFGIVSGAVISDTCLIWLYASDPMSLAGLPTISPEEVLLHAVPWTTAIWYTLRAIQLIREARLGLWPYIALQLVSAPFWVISLFWSKNIYAALPNESGCFIVTAASRGHAGFTGAQIEIIRHGHRLRANQQLLTFWELESRWQKYAPRNHAAFRRIYNRVGPKIAARINSPWLADAVYLSLKPFEIVARYINGNGKD